MSDVPAQNTQPQSTPSTTSSTTAPPNPESQTKKSWYKRYEDAKTGRNVQISDEDLKKYTGKSKAEIDQWAKDRPGVGVNQLAGKLTVGGATGLGGLETANGFGGWGPSAGDDKMKFPPQKGGGEKKEGDESE